MPEVQNNPNLAALIAERDALLARKIGIKPGVEEEFGQVNPDLREAVMSSPSPITITSGFRNPKQNKAIGGVSGSYHTKKGAVDIRGQIDEPTRKHFESLGFQVIPEPKKNHTHIEPMKSSKGAPKYEELGSLDSLKAERDALLNKKTQAMIGQSWMGITPEKETSYGEIGRAALSGAGRSLPGSDIASGLFGAEPERLKRLFGGDPMSPSEYFGSVGDKISRFKETGEAAEAKSPVAAFLASLPGMLATGSLAKGAAIKALPWLAETAGATGIGSKAVNLAKGLGADALSNIAAMQGAEGYDPEAIPTQAAIGLGGSLVGRGLGATGKAIGSRVFGKAAPEAAPLTQSQIWEPLKQILSESAERGEAAALPQEIIEAINTRGLPAYDLERVIQPSKILSPEGVPTVPGGLEPVEKTLRQLVDLKQAMGDRVTEGGQQVAGKIKSYLGTLGDKFGQQNIDKLMETIAQSEQAYKGQGLPQAASGGTMSRLQSFLARRALNAAGLPSEIASMLPYLIKGGAQKVLPEGLSSAGRAFGTAGRGAIPIASRLMSE